MGEPVHRTEVAAGRVHAGISRIAASDQRRASGDTTFTLTSAVAYTRDFNHDDLTELDLRNLAVLLLETADKLHTINEAIAAYA